MRRRGERRPPGKAAATGDERSNALMGRVFGAAAGAAMLRPYKGEACKQGWGF